MLVSCGRSEGAVAVHEEALELTRVLQNRHLEVEVLTDLAEAHRVTAGQAPQ
ncbi:hypothetical protein [Lentzea sp. NBRC 105346]|uniref:hypothetical protein n=1 Tax=Lentzea sp. NBRC 105346 TaxID=3032205 RepID=UPI002555CAB8|nr:hypothetical protein [Lentzea sp. NBRC 105346]